MNQVTRFGALSLLAVSGTALNAQTMDVREYNPRSTLVVPEHPTTHAKFPFVDVHSHQFGELSDARVDSLIDEMDRLNMRVMVNLSGGSGERLENVVRAMKGRYPDRFVVFANLDFSTVDDPEFGVKAARQLEVDVRNGAQGLKIYKSFGMSMKYEDGTRVQVDDPRFDPIWEICAELGIPVLIHTGEPASFFEPIDSTNERWLELTQLPRHARPPDRFPSWETLMGEQWNLFRRNPETIFVSAHLSWLGGNLGRLGELMDELPNMYTEIGAVLAELGRQPRFAKEWFTRYQDRVLFGKDSWRPSEYPVYFRTLETRDDYFEYYRRRHAFWRLYGLDLSDDVLRKLYYENAARIIPGLEIVVEAESQ